MYLLKAWQLSILAKKPTSCTMPYLGGNGFCLAIVLAGNSILCISIFAGPTAASELWAHA